MITSLLHCYMFELFSQNIITLIYLMMRPLKLKAQCVVYDHWSHYGGVHVPCLIPMFLMGFPI